MAAILSIIYFNSRSTINEQTGTDRTSPEEINVNKSVVECGVANEYFVVKDIVSKYYKYSGDLDIKADNLEVYRQAINQEEMKKYKEEEAKERREIANEMLYSMLNSTYIKEFDIRLGDVNGNIGNLSGGNAQKVIIARELSANPKLLIACQPTRGVDIGSIEFIHKQILKFRDAGNTVILISSELSEIMSLSDRVIVMYKGKISGEVSPKEVSMAAMGLLMAGIGKEEQDHEKER